MRATPVRLVRRTRPRQPATELHYLGAWFCYPVDSCQEPDVSRKRSGPPLHGLHWNRCVEPGCYDWAADDDYAFKAQDTVSFNVRVQRNF